MNIEQYLCFNGYEILNANRTETYLRRGLVPQWSAPTIPSPISQAVPYDVVEGDVYEDLYEDLYGGSVVTLYRQDVFTPQNLVGYCADFDFSTDQPDGNYVDPETDDAPWFTSARPESAEFMGLLLSSAELDSVLSRAVNATGPQGGSLGRLFAKRRVLAVSAIMYAASDKGMAYGERWLTDVLSGNLCDDLTDLGDLVLLPACGLGFRTLRRCGVVDGPVWSELGQSQSIPTCHAQKVEFQLAAELPWLYADAVELMQNTIIVNKVVEGVASTEDWVGDAGVRITITPSSTPGSAFSGKIIGTPLAAGDDCNTPNLGAALSLRVSGIPEGNTWIYDSASRSVLEWDGTRKRWSSGYPRLLDAGWLDVPPCASVCVGVQGTAGYAGVKIEQINREL